MATRSRFNRSVFRGTEQARQISSKKHWKKKFRSPGRRADWSNEAKNLFLFWNYLEFVYKCTFSVMPDLIRHPDAVPTPYQVRGKLQLGTISKTGSRFSPETLDSGFRRNDDFFLFNPLRLPALSHQAGSEPALSLTKGWTAFCLLWREDFLRFYQIEGKNQ